MRCLPALAAAIAAADRAESAVAGYVESPSLGQFCKANRMLRAAFRNAFTVAGVPLGETRDAPTIVVDLRVTLGPAEQQLLDGRS